MDAIVYDKVGKEAEKVREALYGIYPQETITDAAIASFDDGADNIPVKALTVGIEPVQDLHGYANPWPGGARKNLLDTNYARGDSLDVNGITYTKNNDGSLTAVGTATSDANYAFKTTGGPSGLKAGTYTVVLDKEGTGDARIILGSNGSEVPYTQVSKGNPATITLSEDDATIGYCLVQISSGTTANLKIYPMICLSTETDLTWLPYSNICPISGRTSAEITGAGKNLFDKAVLTQYSGVVLNDDGSLYIDSNNVLYDKIAWKNIKEYAGQIAITYRYKFANTGSAGAYPRIVYTDGTSTNVVVSVVQDFNTVTLITDANKTVDYITFTYGARTNPTTFFMQIELSSITSSFEEYKGTTIFVTFPTEAGTVYGGTLTLNPDRTGTLVADRAMDHYDESSSWVQGGGAVSDGTSRFYITGQQPAAVDVGVCNMFKLKPYTSRNDNDRGEAFYVSDMTRQITTALATDINEWETWLQNNGGIDMVIKLTNPQTVQLTAEQVSGILETLYGTNNVWADTGNIEKLTYRADLGKYIDSHITTAVANALNA